MPDEIAAPDEQAAASAATLAALVQRVVARDCAALETLYDLLSPRVFALAAERLAGDLAAVEDTVEEVFWQLWRQTPRVADSEGGLPGALHRLTLAAAAETARRRGGLGALPTMPADDAPPDAQADAGLGSPPLSGRTA